MTIVQLEYLLAVANSGSFSAASHVCFVTQPSLSMQIKSLEEELGVILLDRSKKPVVPTEAGKIVIANAREVIRAFDYVKESINELKGEISGTLRIGVIPTIAPYLLNLFVPQFIKEYPKVVLEIKEITTNQIKDHLKSDRLDAAIVSGGTCSEVAAEDELFDDVYCAYVSPGNDLFDRTNIRIEDINVRELILMTHGHCMREQVLEMFSSGKQTKYSHLIEADSVALLMSMADCTNSIAIVPTIATKSMEKEHIPQLKTLAKGAISRKIVLAVRRTYVKHSLISALKESIVKATH